MDMASPLSPSHVLIVYDATKDRLEGELQRTVHNVRMRGDILRPGDTLVVLGILHTLHHPSKVSTKRLNEIMPSSIFFFSTLDNLTFFYGLFGVVGYHTKAYAEHFLTSDRATEKEVSKKVDAYVKMLLQSAEICEIEGVMYSLY